MIQGLWEWLPDLNGKISIVVVPLSEAEATFDWSTIVSTLVVGLVTLAAALLSFHVSNKAERKKREEEEKKAGASNALSAFFKLGQWANLIGNINLHVDKCYAEARIHGLHEGDSFTVIGPSMGRFTEPELLTASEYSFLLTKEHFGIISDLVLIEQRAMSMHFSFQQYSKMQFELQEFIEGLNGVHRELDGPIAKDSIPIEYRAKIETRGAQLNRVIGGIVGNLESDLKLCQTTIDRFIEVAHDKYEPFFPKLEYEVALRGENAEHTERQ